MFVGVTRRLIKNPRLFMGFLSNFWPPILGAGIRVIRVTPDLKRLKVGLPLRFYNRNGVGINSLWRKSICNDGPILHDHADSPHW